jgi:hypothetical protein
LNVLTYIPENALSRGQEIAAEVDERQAVDLNLQPGEMPLHHIWIVHRSNVDTSPDTPRIGIAIRYTKPEVVQESPMKPLALLVRGRDDYGNFEVLPPPKDDLPSEQNQKHKAIVDRIRAGIMTTAERKPRRPGLVHCPRYAVRATLGSVNIQPRRPNASEPAVSGAKSRVCYGA